MDSRIDGLTTGTDCFCGFGSSGLSVSDHSRAEPGASGVLMAIEMLTRWQDNKLCLEHGGENARISNHEVHQEVQLWVDFKRNCEGAPTLTNQHAESCKAGTKQGEELISLHCARFLLVILNKPVNHDILPKRRRQAVVRPDAEDQAGPAGHQDSGLQPLSSGQGLWLQNIDRSCQLSAQALGAQR